MTDAQTETSEQVEVEVEQPKRGRRAARAERKAQRQERKRQERKPRSTIKTSAFISMITDSPSTNREEAEREAAMEFNQAVAPSLDLLRTAVPEASSPEEAWRTIESKLGREVRDPEPELPTHPVYKGDALVYQRLRRHYGRESSGGSFRQGWSRGEGLPPMLGG